MRRIAPRPLERALEGVAREAAPAGLLARVQAVWPAVAGASVAGEAEPVGERHGVVTVACRSGAWAQELELLAPYLATRLNDALGGPEGRPPVRSLRFRTRAAPPS